LIYRKLGQAEAIQDKKFLSLGYHNRLHIGSFIARPTVSIISHGIIGNQL
jgi:hypothetical protein